jgi:hypothetical protein
VAAGTLAAIKDQALRRASSRTLVLCRAAPRACKNVIVKSSQRAAAPPPPCVALMSERTEGNMEKTEYERSIHVRADKPGRVVTVNVEPMGTEDGPPGIVLEVGHSNSALSFDKDTCGCRVRGPALAVWAFSAVRRRF